MKLNHCYYYCRHYGLGVASGASDWRISISNDGVPLHLGKEKSVSFQFNVDRPYSGETSGFRHGTTLVVRPPKYVLGLLHICI